MDSAITDRLESLYGYLEKSDKYKYWNRDGTEMGSVGTCGYYWSSTYYGDSAYIMGFGGGNIYVSFSSRGGGLSVRLVRDLIKILKSSML